MHIHTKWDELKFIKEATGWEDIHKRLRHFMRLNNFDHQEIRYILSVMDRFYALNPARDLEGKEYEDCEECKGENNESR